MLLLSHSYATCIIKSLKLFDIIVHFNFVAVLTHQASGLLTVCLLTTPGMGKMSNSERIQKLKSVFESERQINTFFYF